MNDKNVALSAPVQATKEERARLAHESHMESAHENSYSGKRLYSKVRLQRRSIVSYNHYHRYSFVDFDDHELSHTMGHDCSLSEEFLARLAASLQMNSSTACNTR